MNGRQCAYWLAAAGIQDGDVVLAIADKDKISKSLFAIRRSLCQKSGSLRLSVKRGDQRFIKTLSLKQKIALSVTDPPPHVLCK